MCISVCNVFLTIKFYIYYSLYVNLVQNPTIKNHIKYNLQNVCDMKHIDLFEYINLVSKHFNFNYKTKHKD